MSFPKNPDVGQTYAAQNGTYEFTSKLSWRRLPPDPGETKGLPTTVSSNPPVGPRLGDQWYNPDTDKLFTWATDGILYYWQLFSGTNFISTAISGSAAVDRLLPLTWSVGEPFAFEVWQNDSRYNWRDFLDTNIVSGTAGDDTLDVVSTEGLQTGQSYVVVNPDGTRNSVVEVFSIVNSSRIRVRNNLSATFTAGQNLKLSRTSFEINAGYALLQNGDTYYSRWLAPLVSFVSGLMYIRRTATGQGVFTVRARPFGATAWTVLKLNQTIAVSADFRDEEYAVPFGGVVQFALDFSSVSTTPERLLHMVLLSVKQGVDARRVDTPVNILPLDNAINISTTPTLRGSVFRSIYNLPQNGAEFQIAADEDFKNLILNTSSDFLSSWVGANTYASLIESLKYIETNTYAAAVANTVVVLNGNGDVQRTSAPVAAVIRALATDGSKILAVGVNGSIAVSTEKTTYTQYTAGGGFTGELRGAAIQGNYALAVGANGEIQRSINGGVIWAKIGADNNYVAQFEAVDLTSGGYAIAVGTNGEIQTSANNGATWTKRTPAGGYNGIFRDVTLTDNGYAIAVGEAGELQSSDDFGATWTKRPAASAFAAAFYGVDLFDTNAIAVGAGGEIQVSKDRGITWVHATAANAFAANWYGVALSPDNAALIGGDSPTAGQGTTQRTLNLRASTTQYTVPSQGFLAVNKIYYWRVRYQDSAGFWSEYSKPTVFATAATINGVKTPVNLSPAPNATDIGQQPTLQTSLFAVTGATDTHLSTSYQISTTETMLNPQLFTSATAAERTSLTVPLSANLQNAVKYWWRSRHTGQNNGTSEWSAATAFTVRQQSVQPTITSVDQVAPPSTESADNQAQHIYAQLVHTGFSSVINGDTYSETQYQTSADSVTWPADNFVSGTYIGQTRSGTYRWVPNSTVYLRIRHRGTVSGLGPWSLPFKYVVPAITRGEATYTTSGTYTFTVPANVTSICAVAVGGGGAGSYSTDGAGGGGACGWKNGMAVTPGQTLQIVVGGGGTMNTSVSINGGSSSVGTFFTAGGGKNATTATGSDGDAGTGGAGGTISGADGGGSGGAGSDGGASGKIGGGGGGAGGYGGSGGVGGSRSPAAGDTAQNGNAGGGGGGGLGGTGTGGGGSGGGGVGLYGLGKSGYGGYSDPARGTTGAGAAGGGGSGGSDGDWSRPNTGIGARGGNYGGGGGGAYNGPVYGTYSIGAAGGGGGVRIIWGAGRSFPNNAA